MRRAVSCALSTVTPVRVIGAGLAGCEAAWQLAQRGIEVRLYEQKPLYYSPAHRMDGFAELVCSNSLKAVRLENACGLLKQEMRMLGSITMEAASRASVPAGGALAVDREAFSALITGWIRAHPLIQTVHEQVRQLPDEGPCIVATGPLTAQALLGDMARLLGEPLYFFDAAAPVLLADSLDEGTIYRASRYGRGDSDYLNCPMDQAQYEAFYHALITAERAPMRDFENDKVFEGCMPIEVTAQRGYMTLCFGALKPVGLPDPRTGKDPYAVVQLRQDNREGTLYGMVGFQTNLRHGEQQRVFRMIPGLEHAEFARYGVMHRNSYLHAPRHLTANYQLRGRETLYFAGQISGVEGYVESAASGLAAGLAMSCKLLGLPERELPPQTVIGALGGYINSCPNRDFQPMNANFGILPPLGYRVRGGKVEKYKVIAQRAIDALRDWISQLPPMAQDGWQQKGSDRI